MADYLAFLNEVTERVRDFAESTGVAEVYENGFRRAKSYAEIARLSVAAGRDEAELDRVFAEIGRVYYEQTEGSAEGIYQPLFAQVKALTEKIHSSRDAAEEVRRAVFAETDAAPDTACATSEEAPELSPEAEDGRPEAEKEPE